MTHGTIGGMLITDLIHERENPWTELYDPARVRTGAAVEWVKENLNVALQYKDWVTRGDVASIDQITPDNGAVIVEAGREDRGLPRRARRRSTADPPSARTSAASSRGTRLRPRGIARATDRGSTSSAACSTARRRSDLESRLTFSNGASAGPPASSPGRPARAGMRRCRAARST